MAASLTHARRTHGASVRVEGAARGLVSAVCDQLVAVREPEAVRALVNGWLEGERTRLAKKYSGSGGESDEDEDDEEGGSYCGIPGCKPYFHQHVGSRKRAE